MKGFSLVFQVSITFYQCGTEDRTRTILQAKQSGIVSALRLFEVVGFVTRDLNS